MKEKAIQFSKKHYKILLLLLLAIAAGSILEMAYNAKVFFWSREHGSITEYSAEGLQTQGLEIKGEELVTTGSESKIYINPKGGYVDKFSYSFEKKKDMMNAVITVISRDPYGNPVTKTITDNNPYLIHTSVVTIRDYVEEICVTLNPGDSGDKLYDFQVLNQPGINGMRWLFFTSLLLILLLLYYNRNGFVGKVESMFLLIGLIAGTMLVLIMPLNKAGYDEEVHFRNAYNIKLSSSVSSTQAIEQLKEVSLEGWPENIAQSQEERKLLETYYKTEGDYTKGSDVSIKVPTEMSTVAAFNYIFMGLGIKAGKLLQLPFTAVFTLGRLFNMWSYILLVYLAIKKLPIGKYIMAVVALMPTPVFMAATYSYDAVITGFVYLGLAYLISELLEKDKKITIKNGVILLGSLGFGMVPKAVYVPIMALGFLLPAEKFVNKNQKRVFRIANVVCILGLLATFVLPLLLSADSMGDVRGGNVNVSGQIALILSHPLGYLQVWLTNMAETFLSYGFGEGGLGIMGHLPVSTCSAMIGLLMIFVIFTDNTNRSPLDLTKKQKVAMFGAALLSVAFVWGALYLAFNEVGATFIGGVQGRYYIPLLFIVYLLLRRKNIHNNMKAVHYHYVVFGMTLFIMYKTIYDCILLPYCF